MKFIRVFFLGDGERETIKQILKHYLLISFPKFLTNITLISPIFHPLQSMVLEIQGSIEEAIFIIGVSGLVVLDSSHIKPLLALSIVNLELKVCLSGKLFLTSPVLKKGTMKAQDLRLTTGTTVNSIL